MATDSDWQKLQGQIKQLRATTIMLGGIVAALVALTLWNRVNKPTSIVLASGDKRLSLAPGELVIETDAGKLTAKGQSIFVDRKDGLQFALAEQGLSVFNTGTGQRATLQIIAGNVELRLSGKDAYSSLKVFQDQAELDLSSAGTHGAMLGVTKTDVKLKGLTEAPVVIPPP